ncbi:MAG: SDR family oxidoreductase [Myxococcales bacterium]|nr:SDR family oxidoreductase [Myxococcales bacterium]
MAAVVILGASSGFGAAAARAFARAGFDIVGVHLDRRGTQPVVDAVIADIVAAGRAAHFFNQNAADDAGRAQIVATLRGRYAAGEIRGLLHSLAFGSLAPFVGSKQVTRKQMEMTLDVMGSSLVYWAQDLVGSGLLGAGGRIWAMTSAGSHMVWPGYGPVSAAKAVLEAACRQLAVELAPLGVTTNAILAGVTDTAALRKIPGSERLMATALARNPAGRLTTPEDVADALVLLSGPGARWINGNVLRIDGGEDIAG